MSTASGKRYNSVTSIAFEIQHERWDGEDISDNDILVALLKRIASVVGTRELQEATVCELTDTRDNADL